MAANKATVNVTASVLPDDMKASVGGTIVYDLNDSAGDTENWVYYANNVSTTNQQILPAGISYLAGSAGDVNTTVANGDKIGFRIQFFCTKCNTILSPKKLVEGCSKCSQQLDLSLR